MLRTMAQDVFGIAGTTQGPFIIEEAVAEGGFGVVYKATHGAFRAPVALKCLKIPNIPEAQRGVFLERFREEAEMLFRLSANIPEVVRPLHYDVFTVSSGLIVPFIALEWLEGRTLWQFIEDRAAAGLKPVDSVEAARLLTPVARALEVAHRFPGPNGTVCVVHRDIKPANIFLATVRGNEMLKILDFGIARARDTVQVSAGQMTQSSSNVPLAFTPRYGAPEQWAPKRFGTTGPWTDVWGLAITFLELVAGRAAIDGDPVAIMGTVLDEKRRPTPRNEGVNVPEVIEAVMLRALALDPRDRPSDVGMFWDEMEQALANVTRSYAPVPARRVSTQLPATRPGSGSYAATNVPVSTREEVLPDAPPRSVQSARVTAPAPPEPLELSLDVAPVSRGSRGLDVPSSKPMSSMSSSLGAVELEKTNGKRLAIPSSSLDVGLSDSGSSPPSRRISSPRVAAVSEEMPPSSRRLSSASMLPEPAPEVGTMLGMPVLLAATGALVRALDYVASTFWLNTERVDIGPLRLTWVAGLLIGAGAVLAFARLLKYLARTG